MHLSDTKMEIFATDKQMVLSVMTVADSICVMMCGAVKMLRILLGIHVELYCVAWYTIDVVVSDKLEFMRGNMDGAN